MPEAYPSSPILLEHRRGDHVESVHRGSWVVVDPDGSVLAGDGAIESPFYARSAIKALQALPLFDTGAVERFDLQDDELALALASHSAEACHTDVVLRVLGKLGLSIDHLLCGAQVPDDAGTRQALRASGEKPGALHNNCSGKHAGFLALARQLDAPPESYLEYGSEGQRLVREVLREFSAIGTEDPALSHGIDGCSAPTYRLSLRQLATAFARFTTPDGLSPERRAHCRRLTQAVARHPVLIAGTRKRLCTDLARVGNGRLFPKIGAEAVYVVGDVGGGRALAVKFDDGAFRAVNTFVPALLERLGWIDEAQVEALVPWTDRRSRNRAGLEVGRVEARIRT